MTASSFHDEPQGAEPAREFPSLLYAAAHMVEVAQLDDLDQYEARMIFDAMPEMQAIKLALQNVAEDDRYAFGGITDATQALTDRGLPECVVAWVLT